tara:strand:+ start:134 stop:994 length:861 start_codon:yes stop_codon:yes gene_type:complete
MQTEGGADAAAAVAEGQKKLFRLSDASGTMQFTEVASGILQRNMLDGADVFIVDSGKEVFAWVGSRSSKAERRQALVFAQRYLTQSTRPAYLPISRVVEGGESAEFRDQFQGWPAAGVNASERSDKAASVRATFAKREFAGFAGFVPCDNSNAGPSSHAPSPSGGSEGWMKKGEMSSEGNDKKKDKERKKREKKELKKKKSGKDKKDKDKKDKDKDKDKKDKDKDKDKKDKKDKDKDKDKDKKDKDKKDKDKDKEKKDKDKKEKDKKDKDKDKKDKDKKDKDKKKK